MPVSGSYHYPQVQIAKNGILPAAAVFQNSSSFVGDDFSVLLGPLDVSQWSNFTITLVNNGSEILESGSVEVSPNATDWEVVDNAFFAGLAAGALTSSTYTESSYRNLRVRGIPSGSGGALTGSVDAYLTTNNG